MALIPTLQSFERETLVPTPHFAMCLWRGREVPIERFRAFTFRI